MNSYFWLFLERYVYFMPEPPPRVRTKPMQVLCVGPPRSATESLQQALLTLGYDHTYHVSVLLSRTRGILRFLGIVSSSA